MLAWILLLAQLSILNADYLQDGKFREWFDKAKIGESFTYVSRAGDGCNSCSGTVTKISESDVRDLGVHGCTLVNCNFGTVVKVK